MPNTTSWTLTADTADTIGVYADVVTTLHWECFATDGTTTMRTYGAMTIPPPVDVTTYIDITAIEAMSEADRKTTMLAWAEVSIPGFEAATEAAALAALVTQLAKPVMTERSIV